MDGREWGANNEWHTLEDQSKPANCHDQTALDVVTKAERDTKQL